jgi:hypothetical protein
MITAVEAMGQMHTLQYQFSGATLLVTQVNRTIDAKEIAVLDKQMTNPVPMQITTGGFVGIHLLIGALMADR